MAAVYPLCKPLVFEQYKSTKHEAAGVVLLCACDERGGSHGPATKQQDKAQDSWKRCVMCLLPNVRCYVDICIAHALQKWHLSNYPFQQRFKLGVYGGLLWV